MNEYMFNRCDGSGRVPVRWSEAGDGTTLVEYGPCPCDDYTRMKDGARFARFAAEKEHT
jgi:hypothetical protein